MGLFEKSKPAQESNTNSFRSQPLNQPYTPDVITVLGPRDIFVFGSNLAGHHHGGAARVAVECFGAVMGQGEGLQGATYAIPTMQGGVDTIKPYVDRFIEFAKKEQSLTFYVTKIGCGIAGFKISEIAPLFQEAMGVKNIRLPKEFIELLEQREVIRKDIITHAYGVTRTFADVVIARNADAPFKSPEEALNSLIDYFQRLMKSGDQVAFTAVRIFWHVIREPELFRGDVLNVNLLREKIFDFKGYFIKKFDEAYLMHCKEKICNVVATFNEFRQYKTPKDVIQDIRRSRLAGFNHCGPSDEYYVMSPLHAGRGYPLHFFSNFIKNNWSVIAPNGLLDMKLLNEHMFDKHERGLRIYGLEAILAHDYVQDGPCHPEVYFPKRIGTGPVYVEETDRKYIRSCGEGKGPNSIPNYIETQMALDLIKEDPKYRQVVDYYVPKDDLSLPLYHKWMGRIYLNTIEEKRKFIDDLQRNRFGC